MRSFCKCWWLAGMLAISLSAPLCAQVDPRLWDAVIEAGSGEVSLEHVRQFQSLAADSGEDRWSRWVLYLRNQLEAEGYAEFHRDNLSAAAGRSFPGRLRSGWRARRASLREPPAGRPLLDLETAPGLLAVGSDSVSAVASVVDVGAGTAPEDYLRQRVEGRLVLASGPLAEVYREAVLEREALGVLSYFSDELERGILEPQEIPPRHLVTREGEAVRPGTCALTLMQEMAMKLRRRLRKGQEIRLEVEVEAESYQNEVEAIWVELPPTATEDESDGGETVLLFTHLASEAEALPGAGGGAVLLEAARIYAGLTREGHLRPQRRVVLLWCSDPAAVRTLIEVEGLRVAAAWGVGDLGRGLAWGAGLQLVEPPIFHASWWADWTGWTLERIRRANLTAESGSRAPFLPTVGPYRRAADPFLLNGPGLGFPTMFLESAAAPAVDALLPPADEPFDATELRRAAVAVVAGSLPAVLKSTPDEILVHRLYERTSRRFVDRIHAAGERLDAAQQTQVDLEEAAREAWALLSAARADADSRLAAWQRALPEGEDWERYSQGLERLEAQATEQLQAYLRRACQRAEIAPVRVDATAPEQAAAEIVWGPAEGGHLPEVAGSEMVFEGREERRRLALPIDPETAFQALGRCDGTRTLLEVFLELRAELDVESLAVLGELTQILEQHGILRSVSRQPESVRVALNVAPAPPPPPPPPTPTPEELARRQLASGKQHFNAERYQEALKALRQVGNRTQEFEEARELIATIETRLEQSSRRAREQLASGKQHFNADRYQEALEALRQVGNRTRELEEARELIATIETRLEQSKTAYQEGLDHYVERQYKQAREKFQQVRPYTPLEHREAQAKIRRIEELLGCDGAGGEGNLGVLRATKARGDGRTVTGALAPGEKTTYCFALESPGYGDLEVLVPVGFRIEGNGLQLTGMKNFASGETYARYAREKIPSATAIVITLTNKKAEEPDFECVIYLYPR